MKADHLEVKIYNHYVKASAFLGKDKAVSVGSAFRNVYICSKSLKSLDLKSTVPLKNWRTIFGARTEKARNIRRHELNLKSLFIFDSSVGNLAVINEFFNNFLDEDWRDNNREIMTCNKNIIVPNLEMLYKKRVVSHEWLSAFRELSKAMDDLSIYILDMKNNVSDIRCICFYAYLMSTWLHQLLSCLDFVEWCSRQRYSVADTKPLRHKKTSYKAPI